MSQDTNEIDWNDYAGPGYGAMDPNKQGGDDEFRDIKISLGKHKSDEGQYSYNKEDLKEEGMRKSDLSTGSGSDNQKQKTKLTEEQLQKQAERCCNCLHLDYYEKYFDVTTQDVMQRVTFSLVPVGDKLAQAIGDKPDMYGPFWIYTTLLFLLAFSENLHNFIAVGYDEFQYDFKNVFPSFLTVYGVGFGVPLGLSFLMKYISDTELKFKEITCIYGYSFTSI